MNDSKASAAIEDLAEAASPTCKDDGSGTEDEGEVSDGSHFEVTSDMDYFDIIKMAKEKE